jgi:hypothetical protein
VAFDLEQLAITVDIKPGSAENPINLGSHGVTPVAVIADGCFDPATLDPETVQLAGATANRSRLEDIDGDGDLDLLLHFPTEELRIFRSATEATLTAHTADGTLVVGTDSVRIVGGGSGKDRDDCGD